MNEYTFLDQLSNICIDLLKHKDRLIICIAGKPGTGKSTLGKYIRKNGFGNFSKYSISVIDDSVMSIDLFYVLNKRVKIKTTRKDELMPFIKLLPKRKKLIFCVTAQPSNKVTFTDVLILLEAKDEATRIDRLILRDGKFPSRHFDDSEQLIHDLKYAHLINVEL
jgi:deoxyadenosine/deoxycytidine kinase